jgi:hypothetical protein
LAALFTAAKRRDRGDRQQESERMLIALLGERRWGTTRNR